MFGRGCHPFDNDATYGSITCSEDTCASEHCSGSQTTGESYHESRQTRLKARIVRDEVVFPRHSWCNLAQAKDLIQKLLVHNYKERATVFDALRHPWIMSEQADLTVLYERKVIQAK